MVKLQNPNNGGPLANGEPDDDDTETPRFSEDFDSTCSTPYVSAPSSPGRGSTAGYFFSAPTSPMHYVLSSAPSGSYSYASESPFLEASSSDFEFSSRFSPSGSLSVGSMISADELFLNGQIRPMKLSSHLQRPHPLSPLSDVEEDDEAELKNHEESVIRGRDLKLRSRSLHRKARSLSPLRGSEIQCLEQDQESKPQEPENDEGKQTTPSCSASSSRSSSAGRNSKKWIFLNDLLFRSKSEGRGNGKEKFWSSISFSPSKEKEKISSSPQAASDSQKKNKKQSKQASAKKGGVSGKPTNGVAAKRKVSLSPHELHYTTNRAQAEELKKRTFLPYRQGLLGCLGFNSKGYGALNGLTRALNPVSSG
ncbi:hypothetical protein UlMin_030713 [Ulmus minor]